MRADAGLPPRPHPSFIFGGRHKTFCLSSLLVGI